MLLCSICGKSNREVEHMLAGSKGNVCSECVDLCADVLHKIRAGAGDSIGHGMTFDANLTRADWEEGR